jgi:Rad3-related DNA helicase
MVFFPSYKMMNDVADIYCEKYADETELMLQKNNMSEAEREEFLTGLVRNRTEHLWHLVSWEAYSVRALI